MQHIISHLVKSRQPFRTAQIIFLFDPIASTVDSIFPTLFINLRLCYTEKSLRKPLHMFPYNIYIPPPQTKTHKNYECL